MNSRPNCLSIAHGAPFAARLARFLGEQGRLHESLLLLPGRRAARSMREAFLEQSDGKPMLLPRIQPIGDISAEDALLFAEMEEVQDIPPAISPTRRHLLLTQLVKKADKTYSLEHAAQMARGLADFMDEMAREELGFDALDKLVPEEMAAHWQQTLDFLKIISEHWPRILQGEGVIDPVARRNLILKAVASGWEKNPPQMPIIAAGSTGSQPATARLLSVIARLPQGAVILPGLDKAMPEDEWNMIGETHPQYGLRQLLKQMGIEREDVAELEGGENPRTELLRALFQPPVATARWKECEIPRGGIETMQLLVAESQLDEAAMIAVALRETLESSAKTAALVTPDRQLARMVAAQMQRFGIAIDDSAGTPLLDTPPGCFLRLCIEMIASQAAPAQLLALLRHPLAAGGVETVQCRHLSRVLEVELLRGVRRAPGLHVLLEAANDKALKTFLAQLVHISAPLAECYARKEAVSLRVWLTLHLEFAQAMAATPTESGEARLWAGEAGNALAVAIQPLLEHADALEKVEPFTYGGLLEALLAGQVYRPRYTLHPRLAILSPIEARLLHFDRIILGGLNEGSWPALPMADPWMSRPMRHDFGLQPAGRTVGQSALDVYLLAGMPEIFFTRARKVEGTPTVASRWLVRLETLVKGRDAALWERMQASEIYEQAKAMLDAPALMPPLAAPSPMPPLSARPDRLSVTAIDTYLRDPYVIYARHILKLRALDALDQDPDAADFGNIVHGALEAFTKSFPKEVPEGAYEKLLECGRDAFAPFIDRPAVASLWWPRFEAMARWFLERQKERVGQLAQSEQEQKGMWAFMVDGVPFTLTTRIDRIDTDKSGICTLIDYKTGAVPTKADMERGIANQLPLEALVTKQGKVAPDSVRLEYWKLASSEEKCEIISVAADIEQARTRLEALIRRFHDATQPYAAQENPALMLDYNDYEHLTRRQEWEVV